MFVELDFEDDIAECHFSGFWHPNDDIPGAMDTTDPSFAVKITSR